MREGGDLETLKVKNFFQRKLPKKSSGVATIENGVWIHFTEFMDSINLARIPTSLPWLKNYSISLFSCYLFNQKSSPRMFAEDFFSVRFPFAAINFLSIDSIDFLMWQETSISHCFGSKTAYKLFVSIDCWNWYARKFGVFGRVKNNFSVGIRGRAGKFMW